MRWRRHFIFLIYPSLNLVSIYRCVVELLLRPYRLKKNQQHENGNCYPDNNRFSNIFFDNTVLISARKYK